MGDTVRGHHEARRNDAGASREEARGNWQKFDSFGWRSRPEEGAEDWAIVYTHNRDSELLDLSNAAEIDAALAPFMEEEARPMSGRSTMGTGRADGPTGSRLPLGESVRRRPAVRGPVELHS